MSAWAAGSLRVNVLVTAHALRQRWDARHGAAINAGMTVNALDAGGDMNLMAVGQRLRRHGKRTRGQEQPRREDDKQ